MKRLFFILLFIIGFLKADNKIRNKWNIVCQSIYTNIFIYDKNLNIRDVSLSKDKSLKLNIKIDVNKKNFDLVIKGKLTKLIFVNMSNLSGDLYLAEVTPANNINLYTLHLKDTPSLTISKSYNLFGNISNIQAVYKCRFK